MTAPKWHTRSHSQGLGCWPQENSSSLVVFQKTSLAFFPIHAIWLLVCACDAFWGGGGGGKNIWQDSIRQKWMTVFSRLFPMDIIRIVMNRLWLQVMLLVLYTHKSLCFLVALEELHEVLVSWRGYEYCLVFFTFVSNTPAVNNNTRNENNTPWCVWSAVWGAVGIAPVHQSTWQQFSPCHQQHQWGWGELGHLSMCHWGGAACLMLGGRPLTCRCVTGREASHLSMCYWGGGGPGCLTLGGRPLTCRCVTEREASHLSMCYWEGGLSPVDVLLRGRRPSLPDVGREASHLKVVRHLLGNLSQNLTSKLICWGLQVHKQYYCQSTTSTTQSLTRSTLSKRPWFGTSSVAEISVCVRPEKSLEIK